MIISVLANDSDPDEGDEITITAVDSTTQSSGRVETNDNGTLTYTPPADFAGVDRFTYTIRDRNEATTTATVEVTVNAPVEVQPLVANSDRAQTEAQQPVTIEIWPMMRVARLRSHRSTEILNLGPVSATMAMALSLMPHRLILQG